MENLYLKYREAILQNLYDRKSKAGLTSMDPETTLFHLDPFLCRDAETDPYTGLAYVRKMEIGRYGRERPVFYV